MIAYSPDAEPARAYLLRGYNDIDIFVEDVTAQNMYIKLFGRILAGVANVNQVFPLSDREHVITACANDQSQRNRRRLYIIDADQDLINGIPSLTLNHFYRLNVYSVENLLLSEAAAINIAMESSTNEGWADLAIRLGLKQLLSEACILLIPLFIVYALLDKFNLGIQSVKYPVQRLFTNQNDPKTLSRALIRKRILTLRAEIINSVGIQTYKTALKSLVSYVRQQDTDTSRYISGKTYLLPILHLHLVRVARFSGSLETLKVRLASHCELAIEPGLVFALINAATSISS